MENQPTTASEELSKAIESLTNATKLLQVSDEKSKVIQDLLTEAIELQKTADSVSLVIYNNSEYEIAYNGMIVKHETYNDFNKIQPFSIIIKTENCVTEYTFHDLEFKKFNTLVINNSYISFNSDFTTVIVDTKEINTYRCSASPMYTMKHYLRKFGAVTIEPKTLLNQLYVIPFDVKITNSSDKIARFIIPNVNDYNCIGGAERLFQTYYSTVKIIQGFNVTILNITQNTNIVITDEDILVNGVQIIVNPEYYFRNTSNTEFVQTRVIAKK